MFINSALVAAFALLALGAAAPHARAQAAIQVIVPFPPGGGLDVLARRVTQAIQEQSGESFVVENRPGANGLIGAKSVAAGRTDGRTWLFADGSTLTINPSLYARDPAFDPQRDLRTVLAVGFLPSVLVVHPGLGPRTLKDFIDYARASEVPYVSGGIGAAGHLNMEYLGSIAGLKLRHIPYKGGAPAMTDLIAGQVPAGFGVLPGALSHIRSGKLVALAVSSRQRASQLPAVPTVGESGYPGFEVEAGYFVMVSAKTPDASAKEIEAKVRRVLVDPAMQETIRALGFEPASGMSSTGAVKWLDAEQAKWSMLIREKNIKAE